jgi:hypothetical protein
MSCISREDTCRELVAADVASRLVSVATQYKQANDSWGLGFDEVMDQFPPKLLKEAHKTGVVTKDLGYGAVLTTKEAVGLDGNSIRYGFVTDGDGKRYTISDGLVKEVTGASGTEWQEAFEAAVRSKIAVDGYEDDEEEPAVVVRAKLEIPKGVTISGDDGYGSAAYSFRVGETSVELSIDSSDDSGSVDFMVNDSYTSYGNSLSPRDSAKVAIKLASIIKYDASTRADGYEYTTSAVTSDGQGAKRASAYQRLGFSRPINGEPGGKQYSEVIAGKLAPNNAKVEGKDTLGPRALANRIKQMGEDRKSNRKASLDVYTIVT